LMITEEGNAIAKRRMQCNDCYDGRSLNGAVLEESLGLGKWQLSLEKGRSRNKKQCGM